MTARVKKLTPVVAALMIGWGGTAHAGVIAQAVLEVSNFMFTSVNGNALGPQLSRSQFSQLVFQDSTDATASLNGTTKSDSRNTTQFGTLDLPQQCVGDCIFGENDYSHHNAPTVTVARGDTLLTGAPIVDGLPPGGADAHTLAEVQLKTNGDDGSAQSNLGLVATFSFALNESQRIGMSFNASQWLIAFLTDDMQLGTTAQASSGWTISLAQGDNTLFSWTPDGVVGTGISGGTELADKCDLTRTVAAQVPGQNVTVSCDPGYEAFTNDVLQAGTLYTINLRHTTEADANAAVAAIPEPSVMALMGIGLLGMGLGARRNRKAAV